MERVSGDVDLGELVVGHVDASLVGLVVEAGVELEAGVGRRRGDQVDDHLEALERLAAPVEAHEAEHAVLDLVPLRGAGREMADADVQPDRIGEALQFVAPEPGARVVGPAGVGGDRQCLGGGVAGLAKVLPPADDRVDRELRRLAGDPNAHPSFIGGEIVDAVGDRVPELLSLKSCPRTSTGRPLGSNSRPTALKSPINSRFLASTLITGSPAWIAAVTVSLMCANCASRSGCCAPSRVFLLACRL